MIYRFQIVEGNGKKVYTVDTDTNKGDLGAQLVDVLERVHKVNYDAITSVHEVYRTTSEMDVLMALEDAHKAPSYGALWSGVAEGVARMNRYKDLCEAFSTATVSRTAEACAIA